MNLSVLKDAAEKFVSDNATGLLTAGGVAGTVATAVLSVRAGAKAERIIEEEKVRRVATAMEGQLKMENPVDKKDKVRLVWPVFIPPVAMGSATIASIILANRINAKRIAAVATLYSISENRLKEYQEKMKEKLSGPKYQAVKDEVAQKKVNKDQSYREVLILDGKSQLCYDEFSGRYFQSTMESIRQAEISTNAELYNHMYASLSYFYDELGLAPTGFSDMVGWNSATTGPMKLSFSSAMTPDGRTCLAFDFEEPPAFNYSTVY